MTKEQLAAAKQQLIDLASGCIGLVPEHDANNKVKPIGKLRMGVSAGTTTLSPNLHAALEKLAGKSGLKTVVNVGGDGQGACYEISCEELCSVLDLLPQKEEKGRANAG